MMQIPDPIHGYIELDGMFAHIVNTPEFQRLRSVEQGSFRPVYPGARHDRFAHSLGTYHLATGFVEHFFENLRKDAGIRVDPAERERLSLTFRYAALLHDIGHAPFSHTTEGFFAERKGSNGLIAIWNDLCNAVDQVDPAEGKLFLNRKEKCGAPHEIMSATVLVEQWQHFHEKNKEGTYVPVVDLALAARMVIGLPYSPADAAELKGQDAAGLGVRNCLIQMLNYSVLDVDRLDYMLRDARMSGFVNAPLDLACLARSVTAVKGEDGMLTNAYREEALRVFDLMFQAKLSHDAWVLAAPAGAYDAALLAHCIRRLNERIQDADPDKTYMNTIFTAKALSREGVEFAGKRYRLLSDVDVSADLKAQDGEPFDELYTRAISKRRIAAWRSYYEYHHLFNCPDEGITPEKAYGFFRELLKYMNQQNLFVFDADAYERILGNKTDEKGNPIPRAEENVVRAAKLLRDFLYQIHGAKKPNPKFNVVLLDRTNSFTLKLDPTKIFIVFPRLENGNKRLPLRSGKYNYSTYAQLTGNRFPVKAEEPYFYIMSHDRLGCRQLEKLRAMLAKELKRQQ